jgi:exodeoxyribonuclease V alpha subunit
MSAPAVSLESLRALSVISELDLHFAHAMLRLGREDDARVGVAAALVSRQVQNGHVCLELDRLCRGELVLETDADAGALATAWPELDAWLAALRASPLVGDEAATTPLCLDGTRLYLRRYFEHERSLLAALRERAAAAAPAIDVAVLDAGLDRLFGPATAGEPRRAKPRPRSKPRTDRRQLDLFSDSGSDSDSVSGSVSVSVSVSDSGSESPSPDLQRLAASRAVRSPLCVISGGPGTGKTATVVKILALLFDQAAARGEPPPRVHLLAPTGKAAARLSESIARAKAHMQHASAAAIPDGASTIHRALGTLAFGSQRFRHDRETPLATDVVVVDEASMVDLSLMARLFDAVPAHARVILLGDKNQLASVEAGAVLGDICGAGDALDAGARSPAIARCIVQLTRSYRYAEDSGIRALASAINAADAPRALSLLADQGLPDVELVEIAAGNAPPKALLASARAAFAPFFAARSAAAKLQALDGFRVLCAHRRGAFGQVAINAALEAELRKEGVIAERGARYAGRPILITQNDPHAGLYNGDIGVLLEDPRDPDHLRAYFSGGAGGVRDIAVSRLPPHESVYAMSVHKSQGSEFDEVAVLLPPEPSPVLSRELLYTAITRAKRRVVIYGTRAVLEYAVSRAVQRSSGLGPSLWTS